MTVDPFPPLRPMAWDITLGRSPGDYLQSSNGKSVTVTHQRVEIGRILPLQFILTYAEFEDFVEHHRSVRAPFLSFALQEPTVPASYTPAGYEWKYLALRQVEDIYTDVFFVSITFECVPAIQMKLAAIYASINPFVIVGQFAGT